MISVKSILWQTYSLFPFSLWSDSLYHTLAYAHINKILAVIPITFVFKLYSWSAIPEHVIPSTLLDMY